MKLSTRSSFTLAIALGAFAFIGGTGLTVSSAWLITMASQHPPILALGVSIVMVRFFGIFRSIARYSERVVSHEAIFKKLTGIRVQLFSSFAQSIRERASRIATQAATQSKSVIDDVERAQEFHLRVTLPGLSAIIAGVVTIGLARLIDSVLLVWVIVLSALFTFIIPFAVHRFLDPLAIAIEIRENNFAVDIASAAHAMVEADIYGYGDQYRTSLAAGATDLRLLERKNFRRTSILQLITIASIGSALIGVSSHFYRLDNPLPIKVSMAIFLILVGFEGYTTWFPNLFPAGKNRRASQTIDELTKVSDSIDRPSQLPVDFRLVARECNPFWGESFLHPISFELEPGETLVISGASGAGKSTFAAALLGFAEYSGSLAIGGVEVDQIGDLPHFVTGTLQHGYIFNTTLRENLKIANNQASDEELLSILDSLELTAIGLDEVLGDFGRVLSGGEAKRLSVARALLSKSPLIILDEPLEHLDYALSLRVQEAIGSLSIGRSLIVITHSPWLQYSRKLVLERE